MIHEMVYSDPLKTCINILIKERKMLTSALRRLVKNSAKESFYGKIIKKKKKNLPVFFISHKSDVKTVLK